MADFKSKVPNELLYKATTEKQGIVRLATSDEQLNAQNGDVSSTPKGTYNTVLDGMKYKNTINYPEQCMVVHGFNIYICLRPNGPNIKDDDGKVVGAKDPATETNYWKDYRAIISPEISGVPIGGLLYCMTEVAPEGFLPAAGSLLNRNDYPKLWKFASTSGMIVSETAWQDNLGCFSHGDGSNTFRIPYCGGLFLRPWVYGQTYDMNRAKGSLQGDAIRNIEGRLLHVAGPANPAGVTASGVFRGANSSRAAGTNNDGWYTHCYFDASRVVPVASENRPINIAIPIYIRYL